MLQIAPIGHFKALSGKTGTESKAILCLQSVEKEVFDRLAEGEEAAKTNKPDPSAYR